MPVTLDRPRLRRRQQQQHPKIDAPTYARADELWPGDSVGSPDAQHEIAELHITPSLVLLDFADGTPGVSMSRDTVVCVFGRTPRATIASGVCLLTPGEYESEMRASASAAFVLGVWAPELAAPAWPPASTSRRPCASSRPTPELEALFADAR
jgi:hypothetical protein